MKGNKRIFPLDSLKIIQSSWPAPVSRIEGRNQRAKRKNKLAIGIVGVINRRVLGV